MERHLCMRLIAVCLMLLGLAQAARAQSHELSVRFVEFSQAPTTQPSAAVPGHDMGNIGQVVNLAAIPTEVPAGAIVKREAKLTIQFGIPFAAEFRDGDVSWKVAGQISAPSADDTLLRATIQVQYGREGSSESFNSNLMIQPGKDTILSGLFGATSRCWVLRVAAAGAE